MARALLSSVVLGAVGAIHMLVPSAEEEDVFVALATGQINSTASPR